MTPKDIVQLVSQQLPANVGILLHGAQRNNTSFHNNSDIDVIVIDPLYSDVCGALIQEKGYLIDIVILPQYNIDLILENERFDTKGAFLSMITQGKVLSDKFNLFPAIQQTAKRYFDQFSGRNEAMVEQSIIELTKLKKYLKQDLTGAQRMFIYNDFFTLISNLEAIRLSKWAPTRRHKADLLIEKSSAFVEDMLKLWNERMSNPKEKIYSYIEYYTSAFNSNAQIHSTKCNKRLLIDLTYTKFSLCHFVKEILPEIQRHALLSAHFGYFYLSPSQKYHRKYKHQVSISFCFTSGQEVQQITSSLTQILSHSLNDQYLFEAFYDLNDQYDEDFFNKLEETRQALNWLLVALVNDFQELSSSIVMKTYMILIGFLANEFSTKEELNRLHIIGARKWIFSRHDQRLALPYTGLEKLKNAKQQAGAAFFVSNKTKLLDFVNQGILLSCFQPVPVLPAINQYANLVKKLKSSSECLKDRFLITYQVYQKEGLKSIENHLLYTLLIEDVLLFIPSSNQEKILAYQLSFSAFDELK